MVSPLQTRALPRASELGLFLYAVYATFKVLLKAHNEAVKERKKQEAVTYYLHIVYSSISHIICILSLPFKNTRPTKGFRARSEEGTKLCVCFS